MGWKGRGEVVRWRLGERALVRVLELEGVEQRELRRSSPRIRAEAQRCRYNLGEGSLVRMEEKEGREGDEVGASWAFASS